MRTRPLERPVAPDATARRSTTTGVRPRRVSWNARLAPWMPPPMMTASAVSAIARRGATGASLGRCGARSQAASRGWRERATRARIVGSRAQPMSGEEPDMRFGLFTSLGAQTWAGVLDLWRHVEATGWDIACVTDHFMPNTPEREGPMLEGWSTLTALSALVPRIQVGTIVLGNTYRHPAVVAKMAAQVDIISGGRLLLGLGAGWQENEHEAYGIPFYTMRERLERLDEACQVMKSLWTQRRSDFEGRYYRLAHAPPRPQPVQRPHPELMIGGGGGGGPPRLLGPGPPPWE